MLKFIKCHTSDAHHYLFVKFVKHMEYYLLLTTNLSQDNFIRIIIIAFELLTRCFHEKRKKWNKNEYEYVVICHFVSVFSSRPDPHVEPVRQTPRHFSNSHPYSTKVKNNVLPPPPSIDKVDTIDLSKIPTVNTVCLWSRRIPPQYVYSNIWQHCSCLIDTKNKQEIEIHWGRLCIP